MTALTRSQRILVARAAKLLRPHEAARFERALAGILGDGEPSNDGLLHAIYTALESLGISISRDVLVSDQRVRVR